METSVTLSWEKSMKSIGIEGGFIAFSPRKGMGGTTELARRTIESYMEVLLGEDFDGKIQVRRLIPQVISNVQSLLVFPVANGTGGVDVYVEPSSRRTDIDDFLNDNALFADLLDGHMRREASPARDQDQYRFFDEEYNYD